MKKFRFFAIIYCLLLIPTICYGAGEQQGLNPHDQYYYNGVREVIQVDENRNTIEFDTKFKAPLSISIEHHEIHEGDSYERHIDSAYADVATINVAFKTLSGTKLAHMVFGWSSDDAVYFEILEGATWTQGSGTALTVFNLERNSANVSTLILEDKNQATFTASNQVIKDVTGISGGTVIENQYAYNTGQGNKAGGETREATHEWNMKADETYVIRLTQKAGNCKMTITLHWYEHQTE